MTGSEGTLYFARWAALLAMLTVLLAFVCSPAAALAATPETPVALAPTGVTATGATFNGELNPGAGSEPLLYFFSYAQGSSCGGNSLSGPIEASGNHVAVAGTAEGLLPNAEYAFCVVVVASEAAILLGEYVVGAPVTFKTLASPPALGVERAVVDLVGATLEAEINPNNEATNYTFDYSATETAGELTGAITEVKGASSLEGPSAQTVSARVGGLSPATTYYYRVVTENAQSKTEGKPVVGPVQQFTTVLPPPTVSTGEALSVSQASALVTGTVNPHALGSTYEYQYGVSASYGQSTTSFGMPEGGGAAPASLADLTPGTLYHYRLVGISDTGSSYGEDRTFTTLGGTLPGILAAGANVTGPNTATITGTLNTQGLSTNYGFQIGPEAGSYGPASGLGSLGAGASEASVSLALQNLQPATTYHYRIVAANRDGTQTGADQSFTTSGVPNPLVQPTAPPLIATPAVVFPTTTGTAGTTKSLTSAQKLSSALEACTKKPKKQRASCQKRARKKYASAKRKSKKK